MSAAEKSDLQICRILLSSGGGAPYAENTAGDVLATFNAAVLGQLTVTDESFDLRPGLLESFQFDFEKLEYQLRLRSDLVFHNGRPVRAQDLEYSLLRGFFSPNRSFYNIYLNTIDGIDSIQPGDSFRSGAVSGVRLVDDFTLAVTLKQANPSFLHSLSQPFFSLVPMEEMKSDYMSWKGVPIGAGPYRVASPFADGRLRLQLVDVRLKTQGAVRDIEIFTRPDEANPNYDVVVNYPSGMDMTSYQQHITKMPASVRTIFFSNANVLGQNPHFREAVQKAIYRADIVGNIADLDVTNEILPRHFWGRAIRPDPYSLDAAKKAMAEVPKKLLEKTWRIPVFAKTQLSERQSYFAEKIKAQLAKIGLKVEFYPNDEKFISAKTAKESPFRLSGRVTDYVDPLIMFASFQSDSPYEYDQPRGESKKEFEKLYKVAASASSLESRYQSVRDLSEFIVKNSLAVAIAEEKVIYYYNPTRVESLGSQPMPLILLIQNIRTKK
ncbi:MAG: hypothetical protein KDD35_01595 [Bdellovibrionales bacterium]|nr:hypothetical protein [Bdellovibrionales bacterium]